jgi:hypothetical protein
MLERFLKQKSFEAIGAKKDIIKAINIKNYEGEN